MLRIYMKCDLTFIDNQLFRLSCLVLMCKHMFYIKREIKNIAKWVAQAQNEFILEGHFHSQGLCSFTRITYC